MGEEYDEPCLECGAEVITECPGCGCEIDAGEDRAEATPSARAATGYSRGAPGPGGGAP